MSICLGGALIGCLLSGWIADGVGRRRAFQLCALPMIIGASMRLYFQYQYNIVESFCFSHGIDGNYPCTLFNHFVGFYCFSQGLFVGYRGNI